MSRTDVIRMAGIVRESIVDGPGIRFTVFCQGCPHNCEGCHNPETHDFNGGNDVKIDRILEEIDKNPLLAGITLSGGEPLCQPGPMSLLAQKVRERGLNVTVFSGYTYEEIMEMSHENDDIRILMDNTDILIDGRFVKEQRDLTLQFRGSKNQRVINMNKTRERGEIVIWQQA